MLGEISTLVRSQECKPRIELKHAPVTRGGNADARLMCHAPIDSRTAADEFQLFCTAPADKPSKRGGGSGGGSGGSGGGGKTQKGASEKLDSRDGGDADASSARGRGGKSAAGTFGSRAADFEAAAEEVRREMRLQAENDALKDEL